MNRTFSQMRPILFTCLLSLFLTVNVVKANLITNGSFENGPPPGDWTERL